MPSVFISYSDVDRNFAKLLSRELENRQIRVFFAADDISEGVIFESIIFRELRDADALLVLWSEGASQSPWVRRETQFFERVHDAGLDTPIIPIYRDSPSHLPTIIKSIQAIDASGSVDPKDIAILVDDTLTRLLAEVARKKEMLEKQQKAISENGKTYLEDSLTSLRRRETILAVLAGCFYLLAFVILVGGGYYAVTLAAPEVIASTQTTSEVVASGTPEVTTPAQTTSEVVTRLSAILILIGFVGAGARFTFMLGRDFMNESIRVADRVHAIRYGQFYIKAFEDNIDFKWEELKEVLQHWNIDLGSSFKSQLVESITPQVVNSLIEAVKTSVKPES